MREMEKLLFSSKIRKVFSMLLVVAMVMSSMTMVFAGEDEGQSYAVTFTSANGDSMTVSYDELPCTLVSNSSGLGELDDIIQELYGFEWGGYYYSGDGSSYINEPAFDASEVTSGSENISGEVKDKKIVVDINGPFEGTYKVGEFYYNVKSETGGNRATKIGGISITMGNPKSITVNSVSILKDDKATTAEKVAIDSVTEFESVVDCDNPDDCTVVWNLDSSDDAIALYADAECTTELQLDKAMATGSIYAKAIKEGTADLYCISADDPEKSAVCAITVAKVDDIKPDIKPGDGDDITVSDNTVSGDTIKIKHEIVKVGNFDLDIAYPESTEYLGKKNVPSVSINGAKPGEEISVSGNKTGIVFSKLKVKNDIKTKKGKLAITLKSAKGIKDKDFKKSIKDANKTFKSKPIEYVIIPRDLSKAKVDGSATYASKSKKWKFKLTVDVPGGKPMKLKYSAKADKSDFNVDPNYDSKAKTVKITGSGLYKGNKEVSVTVK